MATVTPLQIDVVGRPIPQGSMRAHVVRDRIGRQRAVMTADARALRGWRAQVAWAAQLAVAGRSGYPLDGPLWLSVWFELPRGHSVRRTLPATRPDLDKLARAVLDALTGVVWRDDGQVVELHAGKAYATGPARARVIVGPVEEEPTHALPR